MSRSSFARQNKQAIALGLVQEQFLDSIAPLPKNVKPTPSAFFQELKDWSELKHRILALYLGSAAPILGSHGRLFYIDGFAGQGSYGAGENIKDGSPVRAAKLAWEYAEHGKPYTFTCVNVEDDQTCFEQLQAATAPFGDLVVNIQGTFADNIDKILAITKGEATICFLDPFGVKGMNWAAVEQLIKHTQKVDFWFRFDHSIVRRLHGHGIRHLRTLSRVYGIDDLDYIDRHLQAPTVEARREKLLLLYETRLVDAFGKTRRQGFAHHYPVRSLTGANKYHMVFASGHRRAAILASEIVYKTEEGYQERMRLLKTNTEGCTQSRIPGLFEEDGLLVTDIRDSLIESIWAKCQGKSLTRDEVYVAIWDEWFGKIKGSHLTSALKTMAANGLIIDPGKSFSKPTDAFRFRTTA